MTKDGSKLLVVNYGMGEGGPDQSLVVFGIGPDGALTAPLASAAHRGTGPNRERQERSHAHSVLELDGGILLVADLGIDRLVRYRLGEDGSLTRLGEQHAAPGAGPRHMVSDPAGRFVFVMNELDSTVASFALGPEGELAPIDSKPAVPEAAKAGNHCADIRISPTAASSTAPIAAMTASPSSPSTVAGSSRSAMCRAAGPPRAIWR